MHSIHTLGVKLFHETAVKSKLKRTQFMIFWQTNFNAAYNKADHTCT